MGLLGHIRASNHNHVTDLEILVENWRHQIWSSNRRGEGRIWSSEATLEAGKRRKCGKWVSIVLVELRSRLSKKLLARCEWLLSLLNESWYLPANRWGKSISNHKEGLSRYMVSPNWRMSPSRLNNETMERHKLSTDKVAYDESEHPPQSQSDCQICSKYIDAANWLGQVAERLEIDISWYRHL
jgi:hypothetical protein